MTAVPVVGRDRVADGADRQRERRVLDGGRDAEIGERRVARDQLGRLRLRRRRPSRPSRSRARPSASRRRPPPSAGSSSRAFCLITSSRTRSFTSSSFGTYGVLLGDDACRTRSRATARSGPATSPSFISNARAGGFRRRRRGRGSARRARRSPDSCTGQAVRLGRLVEVGRLRDLLLEAIVCARSAAWACARSYAELIGDLRPHLVERSRRRRLLVDHLDDVVAELRLHEVADLPRLQRERRPGRTPAPSGPCRSSRGRRRSWRLPSSSEYFFASAAKSAPALACFSTSSAFAFTAASSLPSVLQEDVAGAHLLGRRVLLDVVVVGALDVGRRHRRSSRGARRRRRAGSGSSASRES